LPLCMWRPKEERLRDGGKEVAAVQLCRYVLINM